MNKLSTITLMILSLFITLPTHATCVGGTEFTAENGKKYCYSNSDMNYWSAFSWCQAQGMKFATWADACPNISRTNTNCSNMRGVPQNSSVRLNEPYPDDMERAYVLKRASSQYSSLDSAQSSTFRFKSTPLKVLCVENAASGQ